MRKARRRLGWETLVSGRMSAGWSISLRSLSIGVLNECFCRPFTLIAGTAIGLILLIGAAVSLLSSAGNQELPSVLLAGVSAGERRD